MNKLLLIFVFCVIIFKCEAYLKCFSCENTYDNRCGDYFQLQTYDAVQCQGTCIKRRGRRGGSGGGVEITRGCVTQRDSGCSETDYEGITVTACTCNEDYCNLATNVCSQLPVIVMAVILSFLMRFFY